jgi:hypothetical protein
VPPGIAIPGFKNDIGIAIPGGDQRPKAKAQRKTRKNKIIEENHQ